MVRKFDVQIVGKFAINFDLFAIIIKKKTRDNTVEKDVI